jgi:hypothetical protein
MTGGAMTEKGDQDGEPPYYSYSQSGDRLPSAQGSEANLEYLAFVLHKQRELIVATHLFVTWFHESAASSDRLALTSLHCCRQSNALIDRSRRSWLILCPIQPTACEACSLQSAQQIRHFADGVPDDSRFVIRDHA